MSLNKGGAKIKSNSQYLPWPPAALSTAVHLRLMDCTRFAGSCCEMLPHSSTKAPASSQTFLGGMALALTLRSNRSQTCSMGLRSGLFAGHGSTLTFLLCRKSRTERAVWLVALSCWRVMSGRKVGYHMREEDVLPVTRLVSEEQFLPVLSGPTTVGLCT